MKLFGALEQATQEAFNYLRRLLGARAPARAARIVYARVDEFPDRLAAGTLYVAGEESYPWAAAMRCPCGCGDVITLNLLEQASPRWQVREGHRGTITIAPSIWRTKGCRSHFFIRSGGIHWVSARRPS